MSFRFRLRLFFIVIVLVPLVAVALVLFRVVSDSEAGKSDARLGQAQRTASGLFQALQRRAQTASRRIGADRELSAAIADGDRERIERRLEELLAAERVVRIVMRLEAGRYVAGSGDAIAPAVSELVDPGGTRAGRLATAAATAQGFADEVSRLTGMEVVVSQGDQVLSGTLPDAQVALPIRGDVDVGGRRLRVSSFEGPALEGGPVRVRVLADQRATSSNVGSSTLRVAAILLCFLLLAMGFAITVSRSLQAQIQRLLAAARKLGKGDFHVEVPTEGDDEFAQLGSEFNAMARQLEHRLVELEHEQSRLQTAIRRVGDSFGSGLDPDALLDIAVKTAIDGVGAQCGRAAVSENGAGALRRVAGHGDVDGFERAMLAAERAVLDAREGIETNIGETSVLAEPLVLEGEDKLLGLLTVARGGKPFSDVDRELFHYLAVQAAISMENADLHKTVQRQAVTDELTGLYNHRHFQEVMTAEVERARRYGHDLALIMFDIDNFKQVNDRYGHLQGDLVLREVSRVLRDSAREIDEPARYGGEELAVVLPQTDIEGAYRFAERLRQGIESLEIPRVDGGGTLRVTASFGAAAAQDGTTLHKDELVGAADAALYRAKRAGKNRTVRAG